MKVKKVNEKTLEKLYSTHSFFGGWGKADVELCVKHPWIEPERALYILNARFGKWNGDIDGYKQTFEYVFEAEKVKDVYFTVYDYKGQMCCGFGIKNDKLDKLTKTEAERLNKSLEEVLGVIYSDVKVYDYIFTTNGWEEE